MFFSKNIVFFCLKTFFTSESTNSLYPVEMQHHSAFHLGLHCLLKYPFRGFPNTKVSLYACWVMYDIVGIQSEYLTVGIQTVCKDYQPIMTYDKTPGR